MYNVYNMVISQIVEYNITKFVLQQHKSQYNWIYIYKMDFLFIPTSSVIQMTALKWNNCVNINNFYWITENWFKQTINFELLWEAICNNV